MIRRLPCRWDERPQAWEEVLRKLAWFEGHLDRVGLRGAPGVEEARKTVLRVEWDYQRQPRRTV